MVVTARTMRSGITPVRRLSASIGSAFFSSGVVPSAAARTPSGRSLFSTRNVTLSALTLRPIFSLTRSAISLRVRFPSTSSATRYKSPVSCRTCPSPRRTRYGVSLNPDPSYSPINSTPSASCGTGWRGRPFPTSDLSCSRCVVTLVLPYPDPHLFFSPKGRPVDRPLSGARSRHAYLADGYPIPWPMSAVWSATAVAVALSDSTLAATAALTGAARLALTSDISSRSGRASPVCASNSSGVSPFFLSVIGSAPPFLDSLGDVDVLGSECRRRRVIARSIQCDCRVDRGSDVGVDQRHLLAVGQGLACLRLQLLGTEFFRLARFIGHVLLTSFPLTRFPDRCRRPAWPPPPPLRYPTGRWPRPPR